MKPRFLMTALTTVGAIVLLSVMALPVAAQAPKPTTAATKAWTAPKTSWGDPDLQGIYTSDDYIGLGMNRAQQYGTRQYFTEEEIAAREKTIQTTAERDAVEFATPGANVGQGPPNHWGERARRSPRQTSLIIEPENGQTPALTDEGRARQAMYTRQGAGTALPEDSWEGYTYYIRCITRGIAGSVIPVIYGNGTEIVQGPGYVAILQEMVHEARIIPLDGRSHLRSTMRQWSGDSRGRWDGNTLVVETTNFSEKSYFMGATDHLTVVERFTRVGPDTIEYEITLSDPTTWTKPWTAMMPLRQRQETLYEFACHEGNFHIMSGMLVGAQKQVP